MEFVYIIVYDSTEYNGYKTIWAVCKTERQAEKIIKKECVNHNFDEEDFTIEMHLIM